MRKEENFEQYFIVPDVMEACIETVKTTFAGERFDTIIDPCVGPASYLPFIRKHFRSVKDIRCSDIDPKEPWIEQRDFLENPHFTEKPREKILTFCNPPFGGLKLSDAFIRNVLLFSDAAAFIIPCSYMNHVERALPLAEDPCWRIVNEVELPDNIFTVNGEPFSWKCVLQIWKRAATPRLPIDASIPASNGYAIISASKSKEIPHMWLGKMGSSAGKVCPKRSRTSQWGIKFTSPKMVIRMKDKNQREKMRLLIDNCGNFSTYGSRSAICRSDVVRKLNILVDYFDQTNVI